MYLIIYKRFPYIKIVQYMTKTTDFYVRKPILPKSKDMLFLAKNIFFIQKTLFSCKNGK